MGSALSRLLAVTENYPELKANENFKELQAQLEGTENRISVERRKFNETAREYNTSIRRFPKISSQACSVLKNALISRLKKEVRKHPK